MEIKNQKVNKIKVTLTDEEKKCMRVTCSILRTIQDELDEDVDYDFVYSLCRADHLDDAATLIDDLIPAYNELVFEAIIGDNFDD